MEELNALMGGFAVAMSWHNVGLMLVGILLGIVVGVLPGLGGLEDDGEAEQEVAAKQMTYLIRASAATQAIILASE